MKRHGLIARFGDPDGLLRAAKAMRSRGYARMDAFSPWPVHGLDAALGHRRTRLPRVMLAGGIAGALGAYGLIAYSVGIDYPIDVGGRPLHSWPAYLVLAFEGGILGAALAGFLGLMRANGLPEYYHPVFNVPGFDFADGGGFWLMVEAADPAFGEGTADDLRATGADSVQEVPE